MSYKHTLVRLVAAKLKSNLSTSAAIVASSIAANLVGILQGNYQSMFNLNFDGKVNEYKFEKPKKPSALNTKKNLFAIQRAAFTVDRNTTVQAVLDWIQSTFCVSPTYTRAYGYNVIESDANKALLEVLSEHAFHHTETLTNIFVSFFDSDYQKFRFIFPVVKRNPLKLVGYSPPLENGLQVLNACSTWITSLNEARTRDALCKTLSSLFTKGKKPFESFVEKVTPFLPSVKDLKFPSTFLINLLTYLDTHQADVVQPFFAFKSPTNQNVCSNVSIFF
jgi:hypothetical protein